MVIHSWCHVCACLLTRAVRCLFKQWQRSGKDGTWCGNHLSDFEEKAWKKLYFCVFPCIHIISLSKSRLLQWIYHFRNRFSSKCQRWPRQHLRSISITVALLGPVIRRLNYRIVVRRLYLQRSGDGNLDVCSNKNSLKSSLIYSYLVDKILNDRSSQ